jgi:ATP-dependent protease ClpP protease subunit
MKLLTIENRVAKVRLNDAVTPWSADDLIADIERSYGQKAVAENMTVGTLQCSADKALETLEIEINSPGGSVLDGYRVYNSLMQMRGRGVEIIATVNTLAASMGSVILMAANKVRIVEGGRIMIHEASQAVVGDAATHARAAKLLEEISIEIAGIYAKRTGGDPDEMRELMKAETWMGAAEAMERKFADEIVQFDTPAKGMTGLLAKLFPGNDEALKIEAAIAENDSLRADLVSAEARIQELSGHAETITQLRAELVTEQEKAVEGTEKVEELEKKVEELETRVVELEKETVELEKETEVSEDKVSARAAELLASTGHPAPVSLVVEGKSCLATFNELSGEEATRFYQANRKAIISEQSQSNS